MKTRPSLLLGATALTVGLGLSALAAIRTPGSDPDLCDGPCAGVIADNHPSVPLIRVGDDDDDDDDDGGWRRGEEDEDDDCFDGVDDDDEVEGSEDGEDDDDCPAPVSPGNAAPAGTSAPPANGLFGSGAPPVAVTN